MNRRDWAVFLALLFTAIGFIMAILDMRNRGFQTWWIAQGAQTIVVFAIAVRISSNWLARHGRHGLSRSVGWLFIFLLLVHMLSWIPGAGKWSDPHTVQNFVIDILSIGVVFLVYYEDKFWPKALG
jgi:uncharacterized ion transporter superfamily protein YfcC